MCDLSIVIPTCNRAPLLEHCIASICRGVQCSHEIIVVDGASIDRTPQVLIEAQADLGDRLQIIREDQRNGFVKAANKGFKAARGRYLMWLNDDARPHPGALDTALFQLKNGGPSVAMVALFHAFQGTRNVAYETTFSNNSYRLLHVRGTLYANVGIASAKTFADLNYFDERYFINGADPDFSLKIWNSGRTVAPAYGALIDHDEHDDGRRAVDSTQGREDNERFFAKWNLPPRNPHKNDFDPIRPCTLIGLTDEISKAA